jgi:AcrR family transcriptional regulator
MMATTSRAEQRERVLDVARDLFVDRGFDDVTMAEIAEAAGVARATVFNYFQSKHALVEAITEEVLAFYRAMLDLALADDRSPTPALMRSLFEEMGKGIESDRRFFRGVFREIARIRLGLEEGALAQRANEEIKARLLQLVVRGQKRNELTSSIAADDLVSAFHSLSNGTITDWLYGDQSQSLTARMRAAAEVLLAPVEARPRKRSAQDPPIRAPSITPPRRHEGVRP